MKKLAQLRNEANMALAGAAVKSENGDHLLEVLGIIIIALVILVLFRNVMVPKFSHAVNQTGTTMDALWSSNTDAVSLTPSTGGAAHGTN